jgi:hypothetical protein
LKNTMIAATSGLSANAARSAGQPWPTVVIHTLAREEYRPDIEGPLCVFVNLRGTGGMAGVPARQPIVHQHFELQARGGH